MVMQPPNYRWECTKCHHTTDDYHDESDPNQAGKRPKCPKCGNEMHGSPMVHRGPFIGGIEKQY